jgi:hypothetical protein
MDVNVLTVAGVSTIALKKLLGPSFDMLGKKLAFDLEKRYDNLNKIFQKAIDKNPEINFEKNEDGKSVNPRILNDVIYEGSLCEEDIIQEYYAGILISSRSTNGEDDQMKYYTNILSSMSSYEIQLHYYLYYIFFKQCHGNNSNIGLSQELNRLKITKQTNSVMKELSEYRTRLNINNIANYMRCLFANSLIRNWQIDQDSFSFTPTITGIILFAIANGFYDLNDEAYLLDQRTNNLSNLLSK